MWLDYICSCCCSSLFVGCTFDLMMLHGSLVLADLIIKVSFLWDIEFGCLEGDRGMQVKFQGYLIQKSLTRSIEILFLWIVYGSFDFHIMVQFYEWDRSCSLLMDVRVWTLLYVQVHLILKLGSDCVYFGLLLVGSCGLVGECIGLAYILY